MQISLQEQIRELANDFILFLTFSTIRVNTQISVKATSEVAMSFSEVSAKRTNLVDVAPQTRTPVSCVVAALIRWKMQNAYRCQKRVSRFVDRDDPLANSKFTVAQRTHPIRLTVKLQINIDFDVRLCSRSGPKDFMPQPKFDAEGKAGYH